MRSEAAPGFASVAAAFDFEHHVGSDPALELEVLKVILVREGYLAQIEALVQEVMRPAAYPGDVPDFVSLTARIVELLALTRDQSLEVIEATERWRSKHAMLPPPPFVWQSTNYLLKMCGDLDYLSMVPPLVETLGVAAEQMRRNPLMLESTLDDPTPRPVEEDPAEGVDEDERLRGAEKARLRAAQAVLVIAEERAKRSNQQPQNGIVVPNEQTGGHTQGWGTGRPVVSAGGTPSMDVLSWYEDAVSQLSQLRQPLAPPAGVRGTGRLDIPRREKLQPMDRAPSFLAQTAPSLMQAETKLTDLIKPRPKTPQLAPLRNMTTDAYGAKKRREEKVAAGVRARYMEPKKVWGSEPEFPAKPPSRVRKPTLLASVGRPETRSEWWAAEPTSPDLTQVGTQPLASGAEETQRVDGSVPPVRPMTASVQRPLSEAELDDLMALRNPPEAVAVVAASVLILVEPGNTVPADVRWTAFLALERRAFLAVLTDFEAAQVPKFKLRALKRFLSVDAFNPLALARGGSYAAARLAVWVLRVIAAHPEGGVYIKEVRSALEEWERGEKAAAAARLEGAKDDAGEDREAEKPKKKKKKKKKREAKPELPDAALLREIKATGEQARRALAEVKSFFGRAAALPHAHCGRVLEAVCVALEPKKRPSVVGFKHLCGLKGEEAMEVRLRAWGRPQARELVGGPLGEKVSRLLLEGYCGDPDLANESLDKTSRSWGVLMRWVRAVALLVELVLEETKEERAAERERSDAATRLQAAERKKQAGKRVAAKREAAREAKEKDGAATKLQGQARVSQAKKKVEQKRQEKELREHNTAATKLQNLERKKKAKAVVQEKREQNQAAVKLQGRIRVSQAKKKVDQKRQDQQAAHKDIAKSAKVAIEYDDADAKRPEPKEIFALKSDSAESPPPQALAPLKVQCDEEEEEDDDDDDYGDEDFASPPRTAQARTGVQTPGSPGFGDTYGDDDFDDDYEDDDGGE